MRRRFLFSLAAIGLAAMLGSGCSRNDGPDPWAAAGNKPKILVSFAPLYSFAASVAGPDADVQCLLTTTGPHYHGDATPKQIALAKGCDLFVINGLGLDEELPTNLGKSAGKTIPVLDLGDKLDQDKLLEGACKHDHADGHAHEHGIDPHVWLSVPHAKSYVMLIRDELKKLDPSHAAGYEQRAADYLAKLDKLAADGQAMFAAKNEKSIVSFHESLGYFGQCYGLKIAGVIELQPGKEPTADNLNDIIKKCQKKNVRVIAVEPQFPRNTAARVIRDELRAAKPPVDAEFAEVDPLETCEASELSADLYERKMRENLENLTKALR